MMISNRRILIIGPAWVGDMVMAQTLFKSLKHKEPTVIIDVIAPQWTQPLLERMPEVNESYALPFKHGELGLLRRYSLGSTLCKKKYHQAIVLTNSWKSALIPFFARIPQRTGWRGEMRYGLINDMRLLNEKRYPLMVERFVALGCPIGESLPDIPHPQLSVSKEKHALIFKKFPKVKTQKPILALCPGAEFGPSKCWPAEYYAAVATQKLKEGWAVWLFGSPKDLLAGQIIDEHTQNQCLNFIGQTTLREAIDLLSLSQVVAANDSGLMHIASALQKPVVVMYGSTSPDFTPPLNEHAKILSLDIPCRPCFKRNCPLTHLRCMKDLKPKIVLEALDTLISERGVL